MPFRQRVKTLWRNLTQKKRIDQELDEEILSYQSMLEEEKRRDGLDPVSARRQARIEMGGAERIKEEVRDVRLGAWLESFLSELRQSTRALRRNPALTAMGATMLALGIGASTTVFSIFHAALLQPLPFPKPEQLLELTETRLARGIPQASFTEANFWDVRTRNHSFSEVAAYHSAEANLTGSGQPEKVSASFVTVGFFRTLGVAPVLGRDFGGEDDRNGYRNQTVIVGNRFWRDRFGGDPAILGRPLRLDDQVFTVVGVLPPGEPWIDDQLYRPFGFRANANRGSWEFSVIARLAPDATVETARDDLKRVAGELDQEFPLDDKGIGFHMEPSSAWLASDSSRRALWILLGAVGFLLLIACLNLANLLLARGLARQREMAVRSALGAGRGRLVRFVLMESLLLSAFGAALGVGLAFVSLRAIQSFDVLGIPRLANASLNFWVLAFAAGTTVLTALVSGLAPAWQAPLAGIAAALRQGDRQTGARGQARLRAALVTGEVALSFLLLVGAGLLIRSLTELVRVDPGFQTENRLLFSISMPNSYYDKGVGKEFVDRFLERLSSLPDVVSAGAVSDRPVEGGDPGMAIEATSQPQTADWQAPWAAWRFVTPGYFRAVGLPLLAGRFFDARDHPVWAEEGGPAPERRVVISQQLAKVICRDEDPIGKRVFLWKGQGDMDAEVVGVAGDSRERGLASGASLTVYLPYGRNALPGQFAVHTRANPLALVPSVRAIVAGLDPNLPIADIRSFEDIVYRSVAPQRFNAYLLAVFSGLALVLATTGIYGVLSYSMRRRTAEIGLRVALGATGRTILRMAIGQGMRPALLGIALGALGAWWLSSYFTTLLFEVKPLDLPTYIAVAGLLLATALLACYFPGRRATRTDPTVALRVE